MILYKMFSVLKYLYYGSEKVESQMVKDVEKVIDNEPEIIDNEPKIIDNEPEIIDSYISSPAAPVPLSLTQLIIKPRIESISESSFKIFNIETLNSSLTETILKKLKNDKPFTIKNTIVYLVVKKSTGEPLGVYDSLDKAKEQGQKATYHNCQVIEYRINEPCKYLKNPIFENK